MPQDRKNPNSAAAAATSEMTSRPATSRFLREGVLRSPNTVSHNRISLTSTFDDCSVIRGELSGERSGVRPLCFGIKLAVPAARVSGRDSFGHRTDAQAARYHRSIDLSPRLLLNGTV